MSAGRAKLQWMATETTAVVLTERVNALGAALRAAGVSPERACGLLATAAAATMDAVTLHALLDDQPQMRASAESAATVAQQRPEPISLAA
jgi:hypothetical protein